MQIASASSAFGRSLVAALIGLAGLAVAPGSAQAGPQPAQVVKKMDKDDDGRVSRSEWLRAPQGFKRVDENGDGYVTVEELRSFLQKRAAGTSGPAPSTAGPIDIIDTHVHVGFGPKERDFRSGIANALEKVPERHIALAILIPTPQLGTNGERYDHQDLRRETRSDRFRFAGGSGVFGRYLHVRRSFTEDDRNAFRALAQAQADQGIVAFGEIGLFHFGVPHAGNVFGSIPLDHPLLDILADVAAKSGLPIDVHFDVVPEDTDLPKALQGAGNPDHLTANLAPFEAFLSRNSKTKIVWAHVGFELSPFRTAKLCEALLQRHENLFMSIRLMHGAPRPSVAFDGNGTLKAQWKRLFTSFPDRFVLGSESIYGSNQAGRYDKEFVNYQKLLAQLPPSVAHKIAASNARAIYRLGPSG